MEKIENIIERFLENLSCSSCHDFTETTNVDSFCSPLGDLSIPHQTMETQTSNLNRDFKRIGWCLYIKEFDEYKALILYNKYMKMDIMDVYGKDEIIYLEDGNGNLIISIELVKKDEKTGISIWVPSENYDKLYERMMEMRKNFDEEVNGYLVGEYIIKRK